MLTSGVPVNEYHLFFLSLLCIFVVGCSTKEADDSLSLVASVGGSTITVEGLSRQLGDTTKDSISFYHFLSGWVEKELLYQGGLSRGVGVERSVLQKTSNYKKKIKQIYEDSVNKCKI